MFACAFSASGLGSAIFADVPKFLAVEALRWSGGKGIRFCWFCAKVKQTHINATSKQILSSLLGVEDTHELCWLTSFWR
jgi:hypothetical protein